MNRPFTPLGPALPSPVGAGPTDGYGKRPRCTVCGRGFYGCICDVPEPDVMPVEDMARILGWRKR